MVSKSLHNGGVQRDDRHNCFMLYSAFLKTFRHAMHDLCFDESHEFDVV